MIPDSLTMPLWQLYGLYAVFAFAVIGLAYAAWVELSWRRHVKRMKRELHAELLTVGTPRERQLRAIAEATADVQGRMGRPTLVVVEFDKRGQRGDAA